MVRDWVKDAIKSVNISGNNDKNCMISYLLDKNINENDIVSDILAVFFGIHTVGRTLTEAVLLGALYPDIQQKLYNELITHNITCDNIDEYILKNKDLILDELHYLKAFLYESMRVVTHGFFQVSLSNQICIRLVNIHITYIHREWQGLLRIKMLH